VADFSIVTNSHTKTYEIYCSPICWRGLVSAKGRIQAFPVGCWHGPYNIALRYRAGMWYKHIYLTLLYFTLLYFTLLYFTYLFFFLFCYQACRWDHWADLHARYLKRRGLLQGSAFSGSHRWNDFFTVEYPFPKIFKGHFTRKSQKSNIFGQVKDNRKLPKPTYTKSGSSNRTVTSLSV
jgi:hypothetical protein